jgi:outer membrane immunogenic protein
MIRRFTLSTAAVALCAAAVAAPAMAQTQDQGSPWSGWYVGANLGLDWGGANLKTTASAPPMPAQPIVIPPGDAALLHTSVSGGNKTGFTGGIEGGYNWRYGDWLLGIETDYGALDVNQTTTNQYTSTGPVINPPGVPVVYTLGQRATTSWMWTLRPRVGWVSGPLLIYGTAGVATSGVKMSATLSDNRNGGDTATVSDSATKTGWAGGGGVGWALGPHLSVKGEYLYADFGSLSITRTSPNGYVALTSQSDVRANLFRVGVDYRF